MDAIYLNDWQESKLEGLMQDFEIKPSDLEGVEILLASYSYKNYSGDAFVLFMKDGKLFEVNGSHCSCYGLEGQWGPEKADIKELYKRVKDGQFGSSEWRENEFRFELFSLLQELGVSE